VSIGNDGWVKPRLRKQGCLWECYLPTTHYLGREIEGYGLSPKTAYIRFLEDAQRLLWEQLSPWCKFKHWMKDIWRGRSEQRD
jgi:hypothetical protein